MAEFQDISSDMLSKIIKANTLHVRHQMESLKALYPQQKYTYADLSHSFTIQCNVKHGVKLNHTVEFGMRGPVTQEHLLESEACYEPGLQPTIMLCENAHPSAETILLNAGYSFLRTLDTFIYPLSADLEQIRPSSAQGSSISITRVLQAERSQLIQSSITGFASTGRATTLLSALAESAANRPDTTLYFARDETPPPISQPTTEVPPFDSPILGTAALSILSISPTTKIANLYLDSTLPTARGRGVHAALIRTRTADARAAGCEAVIASAQTDGASARSMLRAGMQVAFTTKMYVKNL